MIGDLKDCINVLKRGGCVEEYILWFDQLGMADVERVGGKNASLGEDDFQSVRCRGNRTGWICHYGSRIS